MFLLLVMAGFSAGHSFARVTLHAQPTPAIVNRISQLETEISKLDQAIARVCRAP
ncbi:hypothetical protein [Antarcticirhabdus aurantiaca]|uniref:hypothetical protein n=1 Tax=Antarcticirhabdus aurantiaca TaxID=2606717 RepID=UPI00131B6312|nr:hypothetical protein [Antarcticirhabdus aurantiaca]